MIDLLWHFLLLPQQIYSSTATVAGRTTAIAPAIKSQILSILKKKKKSTFSGAFLGFNGAFGRPQQSNFLVVILSIIGGRKLYGLSLYCVLLPPEPSHFLFLNLYNGQWPIQINSAISYKFMLKFHNHDVHLYRKSQG